MVRVLAMACWLAGVAVAAECPAGEAYTYSELVRQMLDLERLAVLPAAGNTAAQWSSYDRASRYDAAGGKYVKWDANGDGTGIIRKEGGLQVLAEMEGPGCLWRIWSAQAEQGRVKIYLDGQAEPALDMPFAHYFDGKHAPLAYPRLSYDLKDQKCRGQNLYVPIPYQRSCKIVAEEGWGRYYQFNYETYPRGTQVPTFSRALAAAHAADLAAVDTFFASKLGSDPAGLRPGQETVQSRISVAPGRTARVAQLSGARAITAIRARAAFADRGDEAAALRRMALRITWDGQPQPAVWCPLGDFFGTAPGVNPYKSLVTGMTERGWYALWYMPFEKSALVELVNDDATARSVEFEVVHAPLSRSLEVQGHFHLKWHRDTKALPADRWPDWTVLETTGRGRFCGMMLHVWNPRGGWWGEGDEKFFVDGEKFPSTIGTGSEDYFGYAWCHPGLFQTAYHCQTMTQKNRGHQSVLRWHVVDSVPFQKSFEACLEKYYGNREKGTLYACTAAWYLAAGGGDPYGAVPADQRHGYDTLTDLVVAGFKVLNTPAGEVQLQSMAHFGAGKWRNNEQLWWTGARPKARLELAVRAPQAGTYALSAMLTKARDYGIVQLWLDGQRIGEPIDLYHPTVVPTAAIPLGLHDLTAGEHKLSIEIVGANPKALPAHMVGISQLEMVRVVRP